MKIGVFRSETNIDMGKLRNSESGFGYYSNVPDVALHYGSILNTIKK